MMSLTQTTPDANAKLIAGRRRIASMLLYANGKIAALDEHGEQIPQMQMRSAIELWAEYASASGFDVVGCKFSTQKPGGAGASGTLFECVDGFDERWDDDADGIDENARLSDAAEIMLAALQRQHDNINRWLATGVPADAEESRSIAEQIAAAIQKATGDA